jgi:hypothetical protein
MTEHITCRDCQHWYWPNTFNLADYPRDRPVIGGYADGVCTELKARLEISCSGGWNGCTIDSVETDANFYCVFATKRLRGGDTDG